MADHQKITISLPNDLCDYIGAQSNGNKSLAIATELRTFRDLTARAVSRVRAAFTADEWQRIRAALCGTLIEPSIVPHLASEIEEGLDGPDMEIAETLRMFGLLELYAVGVIVREPC